MIRRSVAHTLIATLLVISVSATAGTIQGDWSFYKPVETPADLPLQVDGQVKNVILLIGDGMGFSQVSAAQFAAVGPDGYLKMQTMPVTGQVKTQSANDLITDSGAAGTAIATGHKTDNGMISMLPDGTPVQTIMEAAESAGMSTGLIATSTITHATPAAFASHVQSRSNQSEIALQMSESGVDVIFGGGWQYWLPAPHGSRDDGIDLFARMRTNGYQTVQNRLDFQMVDSMPVIGLFRMGALNEDDDEPRIDELTRKAINLLSEDEDGFFLMVEGSQIDWKAHDNEEDELVRRLLLFDMAVAEALDYADLHGNTLVIVTADHETGGMTLTEGSRDGRNVVAQFSATDHTAGIVPLFAFGPGAIDFTGVYDDTEIPLKMARSLGLAQFTENMKTAALDVR